MLQIKSLCCPLLAPYTGVAAVGFEKAFFVFLLSNEEDGKESNILFSTQPKPTREKKLGVLKPYVSNPQFCPFWWEKD